MAPSLRPVLARIPRPSRRAVRITAIAFLLVGTLALVNGATSAGGTPGDSSDGNTVPYGTHIDLESKINHSTVQTAPIPADAEVTVLANQGFFPDDENAELVAFTRNGTVVYHNSTYGVYFDVDPVPGTRFTVEYLASEFIEDCPDYGGRSCTRNVLERVNLSTGTIERVYAEITPGITATRWHDADRINETHVALADIHRDSLRVINVSSGETTWEWFATTIYDHDGDHPPQDWTHLNDVEVLENGTFMLSMRNMDEVVFVRRGEGYLPNRTLGSIDEHRILHEQHNPDYIPESRGGPAVIVGDSENNRVVEYHRENGAWNRAWIYRDAQMQWPRDADRLPNGRTLIVDSNGDRLLEVDPNGSVAWSVHVGMPYDVERLGTGDESTGGPAIGSDNERRVVAIGPVGRLLLLVKDTLPSRYVNGALFTASAVGAEWFGFVDLLALGMMVLVLLVWAVVEYRWARWSVTGQLRQFYRAARDRLGS